MKMHNINIKGVSDSIYEFHVRTEVKKKYNHKLRNRVIEIHIPSTDNYTMSITHRVAKIGIMDILQDKPRPEQVPRVTLEDLMDWRQRI